VNIVVDTNILLRFAQPTHPQHSDARMALHRLTNRDNALFVVPQVLYEFWVVCTRPLAGNGFGLTGAEAAVELKLAKSNFAILPDKPELLPTWEHLVTSHDVRGKNAHDARIAAAMLTHGVSHLLTFNPADFARFPGLTLLNPLDLPSEP
jgi:predicted nucleic acid-binding protein